MQGDNFFWEHNCSTLTDVDKISMYASMNTSSAGDICRKFSIQNSCYIQISQPRSPSIVHLSYLATSCIISEIFFIQVLQKCCNKSDFCQIFFVFCFEISVNYFTSKFPADFISSSDQTNSKIMSSISLCNKNHLAF